jgi:hypothetical protein
VYCVGSASIVTALLAVLSACVWFVRGDLLGESEAPRIRVDEEEPQIAQITQMEVAER